MTTDIEDYSRFFKFIETYSPSGFLGIDRDDPLIIELEELTRINNQYFFVGDLLNGKIIFSSKRSFQMIGVDPKELTPYHNLESVHPDEVYRNTNGWAKLLQLASGLFIAREGFSILSVNMKMRNPKGLYSEILFQAYIYYSGITNNTVYLLMVLTNIDWCKKIKHKYHYYIGNDLSYFRYPDEEMLQMGNVFTRREFEIIRLIASGLNTEQIAEKLFLSPYTVNTHRGNILKKTSKANIPELIYEIQEKGLL